MLVSVSNPDETEAFCEFMRAAHAQVRPGLGGTTKLVNLSLTGSLSKAQEERELLAYIKTWNGLHPECQITKV